MPKTRSALASAHHGIASVLESRWCDLGSLLLRIAVSCLSHLKPRHPARAVVQVTQIMVPLLKFYFHEEVRQAAVQAMPELLRSASLAVAAARGPDTTFVKQMLDFIWTPLMEAMAKVNVSSQQ